MSAESSMESQSMSPKAQLKREQQIFIAGTKPQLNLANTITPPINSPLTTQSSPVLSQSPKHGEQHKLHGAVPISVTADNIFEMLNTMTTARISVDTTTLTGIGIMMDNFKKNLWHLTNRHISSNR